MKSIKTKCLVLLVSLLFVGVVVADSRYITDIIYVPMRAGPGNQYKVIHQGLKTGTQLTLLEAESGNNYSKVSTPSGLEGYIRTQYLLNNPPALLQLPDVQANVAQLLKEKTALNKHLKTSEAAVNQLKDELNNTTQKLGAEKSELKKIQMISADTLAINQSNQQLQAVNIKLQKQVNLLKKDNKELTNTNYYTWFLYGGGTILLGIILGLILPRMKVRKKQPEHWI